MNAIEVRGLCKSFKGFDLKNINLTLPEGCIMGLVGENGAGKTTTLKLIMNAMQPDSGFVNVLGTDNSSPEFNQLKNRIGVVLDEAYFPGVLTAADVGKIMALTYSCWDSEKYAGYLKKFHLDSDKQFKDYSRGMKMKLAIAAALSHDPKVLILDEATSGLDPMMREEILDILMDFTRDESHSILLSSHIVSDLEKVCDYIAFIHEGELQLCEEKDALLEKYAVVKMTAKDFARLRSDAVIGSKRTSYSVEALVERAALPADTRFEHATLEDIILYIARRDRT